jgi:hypothetical protein
VKHATSDTLSRISSLLVDVRKVPGLVERKPGVFYRKSRAFLHFHEHGDDVFADLRLAGPDFERHRVTTRAEQRTLLQAVRDGAD